MEVIIAFGANLGEREETIELALSLIEELVGQIKLTSRLYETEPLLDPENPIHEQPMFINGVVQVETTLTPEELLSTLQEIERELGRVKTLRWGPRTIDLDIIAIGDLVINTPELVVPHPEMHKREFVLEPLAEILPGWVHPVLGVEVEELLRRVRRS